jgi:hypothetical protein
MRARTSSSGQESGSRLNGLIQRLFDQGFVSAKVRELLP